jgi:beta-glucosidase
LNAYSVKNPLYKKADAPIKERVEDLLKRMTLDEKLGEVQFRNINNISELDKHTVGTDFAILRKYEAGIAAEKYNRMQR